LREGLLADYKLRHTDWEKMRKDIDEIAKSEEERKNAPDIFSKPDVDPNRKPYSDKAMTDEEIQKAIDEAAKKNGWY
jgi:hypothetical protein